MGNVDPTMGNVDPTMGNVDPILMPSTRSMTGSLFIKNNKGL